MKKKKNNACEKKDQAHLWTGEQNKKTTDELFASPSKKKNNSKIILVTLLILVVGGAVLFIKNFQTQSTTQSAPVSSYKEPTYTNFVSGWNDKVRAFDLAEGHLISSTDNEVMLRELKTYISYFSNGLPKKTTDELAGISRAYPHSIWAMYRKFLITHVGKHTLSNIDWSSIDSSEKMYQLLLSATRSTDGLSDIDESIKLILAASDPCAYFSMYKTDLWKQGLSKNFRHCDSKIINNERDIYPSLAVLIK